MIALGPLTRTLVGAPAVAFFLLGLSACGPQVTSGDENFVLIKVGPLTSFSNAQSSADEYCTQHGKRASVEGSEFNTDTLQDTYRFKCVEISQ